MNVIVNHWMTKIYKKLNNQNILKFLLPFSKLGFIKQKRLVINQPYAKSFCKNYLPKLLSKK